MAFVSAYRRKVEREKNDKRAFIGIWMGTLLDSYDAILAGLEGTCTTYQPLALKIYLEAFGSRSL